MELEFTQDQDDLRGVIRAVLVKEAPIALARDVFDNGARADALWATFIEL